MAYKMDKFTDSELKRLEKRLKTQYKQASNELNDTWKAYINGYDDVADDKVIHHKSLKERWQAEYSAYQRGEYTKEQFQQWEMAQLGRGKHWEDLKSQMAQRLVDSTKISSDYINGILPKIYTANSNGVAEIATKSAMKNGVMGVRFDMVDEHTIKRLMAGSSSVRPYKKVEINLKRAYKWNLNKCQNALLQGILQGDSIDHMAQRFSDVAGMNRASAIRNARTAVTGAQNAGKQDRYEELAEKGCIVTKIWVATEDDRTRPEHAEADGQSVNYDEYFDVGGEELMYPADPSGSDWNIYNCRCTMKVDIGFKSILDEEQRSKIRIIN